MEILVVYLYKNNGSISVAVERLAERLPIHKAKLATGNTGVICGPVIVANRATHPIHFNLHSTIIIGALTQRTPAALRDIEHAIGTLSALLQSARVPSLPVQETFVYQIGIVRVKISGTPSTTPAL
ncbi:hypothetical protein MAR_023301 [Mya arenaria]|uniref:Uncharacterized protein n=1 Tax=Mya arenaria TaxID=6604 RepID=A0ABY7DP89_MYAAR|nr:hypothetical protein MAR_023301 [Mya arenaria]